jgi:hypothetical protein
MLLVMLCHASLNASIVPLSTDAGRWPSVILAISVAAAVALLTGGKDLADKARFRWSMQDKENPKNDEI